MMVTSAFGRQPCGPVDPPLPWTQPTHLPVKVPEPVHDAAAAGDDAAANNGNWYGSATVATVDPAPADAPAAPADAEAAPADPEAAPDVREGIALQWLNKVPPAPCDNAAPPNSAAPSDDPSPTNATPPVDHPTANNLNGYGSATVATVDPAPADVREGIALECLNKVPALELQAALPDGSLQNWVHSLHEADVQDLADDMWLQSLDSMS